MSASFNLDLELFLSHKGGTMGFLERLPEDVLLHIFSLVSVADLGRLARTSRYLSVVASKDEIWKSHCLAFKLDPHAAIVLRFLTPSLPSFFII